MMLKTEIPFVDPSVSDLATTLGGLLPGVEGVGLEELGARFPCKTVFPPLTQTGMASYLGVFSARLTSAGGGQRFNIHGRWPASTQPGTYFIVLDNNGTSKVIGKFIVPMNSAGTFAISEPLPAGSYAIGANTPGQRTISVYSGKWNSSDGTWSLGDFNSEISATLNGRLDIASHHLSYSGEVG